MFHHTVETDKPIEEAVSSLEASLKGEKFGVLGHFDIKETLESKGLEFDQLGGFFQVESFQVLHIKVYNCST